MAPARSASSRRTVLGAMCQALALLSLACLAIFGAEVLHLTQSSRWPSPAASATGAMQAVLYEEHGAADVMRLAETAMAQMSEGMIKVRVRAAGLNPLDFKLRRTSAVASAVAKPKIVGADVSGVVIETAGSTPFQVGDEVFSLLPAMGPRWGAVAEFVAFDHRVFAKAPKSIPLEEAAALPMAGVTMLQSLSKVPTPQEGASIFIQAGGGGVGVLAIQYAKRVLGFKHIITTARSDNARPLYQLGATTVVDYERDNLRDCSDEDFLRAIGPVDVVFDTMAFAYEDKFLRSGVLKPGGHYVHIVSSDWKANGADFAISSIFHGMFKKWKSKAQALFDPESVRYHQTLVSSDAEQLTALAMLVDEGKLKPVIHGTYAMRDFQKAFEVLESGHAHGKVLIFPHDEGAASEKPKEE